MTYFTYRFGVRWLFLLSVCLMLLTCKQEGPLPYATQTGQNTFGCMINGKPYVPDGGRGMMPAKPVYGGFLRIFNPLRLGVYIYTYAKDKQHVEIFLNDYTVGKHPLNSSTQTMPASLSSKDYGLYESGSGDTYVTSSLHTGQVTIVKADTATGIVAGTFEFKAATSTGKTVTISNGRFDVNARTQ